jgi:hypothetical protein
VRSVSRGVKYSGLEHCHHSHFFGMRMKKDGCPIQVERYKAVMIKSIAVCM